MSEAALVARALRRQYLEGGAALAVLRGVDLSVARGERVAIIGSSGSGKSTLLHLLGGLDRPDAGEVRIGGELITGLSPAAAGRLRNRALGFVYQFHHLLAEFSAVENVALPLLIRGQRPAQAARCARAWLARVGLSERAEHKPGQLSGGERQRVAIARALVAEPCCVLADEPTGNLDQANSTMVFDLLGQISREAQTAFVVVTHDRALAERMDRVLVLCDGRLGPG